MPEVRPVRKDEADQWLRWRMETLDHVFGKLEGEEKTALTEANRAHFEMEHGTNHLACFLEADGHIIGCGDVCFQKELPSPDNPSGKAAYFMNIYVREPYRHQGGGKAIMQYLMGQCGGIGKLYLEASECGKPLYKSLGFTDMEDYLKIE